MQRDQEAFDAPAGEAYPNLLWIAWQRKALLVSGAVIGLVLGALYYAQRAPVYQSSLQLLVVKKRPDILPIPGEDTRLSLYEDYLSTHLVLIRSPLIIDRAAKKQQLQTLKTFAGQSDPTGLLIGSLSASRDSKDQTGNYNNILNLSFRSAEADECGTILHAVVDSYKDFLEETYRNVSKDTLQLITRAKDILFNQLAEKDAAYRDFRLRAHFLWKAKGGTNLHQERLITIESKRSALLVRRAELQGRLAAVEKAVKNGVSRADVLAMASDPPSRPQSENARTSPRAAADDQLLALLLQEEVMLEDHGPDHPHVESMRKRLRLTRDFYANPPQLRGLASRQESSTGNLPPTDPVEFYTWSLKQELEGIKVAEQALTELFGREYNETKEMIKDEIQDEAFRSDIDRTQQLYNGIIKRLQEIDLVRDFGGYDAQVISPAGSGWKVEPKPTPIFAAAAFLGVLAGLGLAYLAEVSDKSFRTPEEIRRRLGLPIVGHIPWFQPNDKVIRETESNGLAVDPILCTYYQPKSMGAETYRGVRTALYFSTQGEEHKVIQITSPNPADGKTTVVANLAVSIAQSGKRTILIDADFRRPRVHKLFGLTATAGVTALIAGELQASEVIQPSGILGLSILPCGPQPPNPAELLTSPRFKEVLDSIREQYDFVLLDTPPLLAVTDPSVVAPRMDGVLLVVRASRNGRPDAERAKEILGALGANVLGVIVNGVDSHAGYAKAGRHYYRSGSSYYGYRDDNYCSDSNTEEAFLTAQANTTAASTENDRAGNPPNPRDPGRKGRSKKWRKGLFGRLFGRLR